MKAHIQAVLPNALAPGETEPLYRQAKRELQKLIEARHYGPNQALPSETSLSKALGISIGTLRHAVDELVHDHVLLRRQGKGTFVAPHNPARFLFQFFHVEPRRSFGEEVIDPADEYPEIDCIAFQKAPASEEEALALRIKPGESVFRLENRLSLKNQVVMHDCIALSAALFRQLTEKRFVDRPSTIYSLYQTDFGITVLRTLERARAVAATKGSARVLGVLQGSPVMEVHRLALSFGDRPVEYRVSTINTKLHDYVNTLTK